MVLYYALGGGLGHVTRARAVLHTLGLSRDALILASSPVAADWKIGGGPPLRLVPQSLRCSPDSCREWLHQVIDEMNPTALFLDTFPAGIMGEFSGFNLPRTPALYHVARLLNPAATASLFANSGPDFETTYLVENVSRDHRRWLETRSRSLLSLALTEPPISSPAAETPLRGFDEPYWLVVHSGPDDETEELLGFAADMRVMENPEVRFLLISPHAPKSMPPHTIHHRHQPASDFFPGADRIIGGGGFNFVRETAPFRAKTRYLPFSRRYDDQYARVAGATAAGADIRD